MFWDDKTILLTFLLVYISTQVAGLNERQQNGQCAELNSTRWLQSRQHRIKLQVQYLLLTRRNQDCAQRFSQASLTQQSSHFNVSCPTKVIIHGYRPPATKPSWMIDLAQALLTAQDVNVVIVDWVYGASFAYNVVVENYKEVALQISVLINQLLPSLQSILLSPPLQTLIHLISARTTDYTVLCIMNYGCEPESFHLLGVSLGAHVAGFVGTLFEGQIGRITGLDPAGPMFKRADTYDRLDPSDAQFVDAIHTDSDYFGISIPVGHVDFFLNGGKDQNGCSRSKFSSMYGYVICDHMRAMHVYMNALNGSCTLMGFPCSTYEDFLKGDCMDCELFKGRCPVIGLSKNSGITTLPLPREQKLFLLTTSSPPFCAHHILLKLEVSGLEKSAEVEVRLMSKSQETEQRLRLPKDTTEYKIVLAHPAAMCEIEAITLKNTGARLYRQGEVHIKSVCISELPFVRDEQLLCVNNINLRRGVLWSHDLVQVCEAS